MNLDETLFSAIDSDDIKLVKAALIEGASINARNNRHETPLVRLAWMRDKVEMFELLLRSGVDINAQDKWGCTALHHVAYFNYDNIVKLLLEYGADYLLKNSDGDTALNLAEKNNSVEAIKILIKFSSHSAEKYFLIESIDDLDRKLS